MSTKEMQASQTLFLLALLLGLNLEIVSFSEIGKNA